MGTSIAMSGLGNVVAAGAPKKRRTNSGDIRAGSVVVRYLDLAAFEWRQFGRQEFTGAAAGDACGTAVALATNGFALAFGCPGSDRASPNAGTIVAFETTDGLGGHANWKPIGGPITGVAAGEQCGVAIDLSEFGDRLAYGCPQNDTAFVGTTNGVVRVTEFQHHGKWRQMGSDIKGDGAIGSSLALSGIGNVVAYYQSPLFYNGDSAVSPLQSNVTLVDGNVTILFYNGAQFIQVGQTIDIDGLESFPFALDLTRDGLSIVIGAVGSNDPGRVQAFRLVEASATPSPTPIRNTASPSTTSSPSVFTTRSPTGTPVQVMSVAPTTRLPTTTRTVSPST
jgi:hypothetical protein